MNTGFERNLDRAMGAVLDEFLFGKPKTQYQYDDTGDALELSLEAPGIRKEDLKISVNSDVFTISGHKRSRRGSEDPKEFSRHFDIPQGADAERAEASLQDGILTVRFPKIAKSALRLIPIKG